MLSFVQGHSNTDVIVFYLLASAMLALVLYRHYQKPG
jgi:hypothetical protein